ncbi:AraC-like ligand-binding domain-containing protein [Streptomyces sp. NPDC001700]
METVFDSDGLSVNERTEAWTEAVAASLAPCRITFPEPTAFGARLQTMELGAAQLVGISTAALHSYRAPSLIRQSDPECYQICLIRTGQQGLDQVRRRSLIEVGDLTLYDSSRPFDAMVPVSRRRAESLVLQLPKRLLPLRERQVAELLAVPIPGQSGVGRLLAQFLQTVADEESACTGRDRIRLAGTAIDLVAATLAHHLDRSRDLPPESRQQVLFLQIGSYVQQHLADADLGPARIAAVHHISVRSLHRLFQQHGVSVHSWIRGQRLASCRRDLEDPLQRHVPIRAVAARWGFPRPADFTRAFRARFGMPPSDYRHHHAHQHGTGPGAQKGRGRTESGT